eukprot:544882-Prymnesium_polylepis.1
MRLRVWTAWRQGGMRRKSRKWAGQRAAGLRTWSEHAGVSVKQLLAPRTKPSARRNEMAPSDA